MNAATLALVALVGLIVLIGASRQHRTPVLLAVLAMALIEGTPTEFLHRVLAVAGLS